MKYRMILIFSALILLLAPSAVMAQDYDFHPALSDTFTASIGAMRSSNSFKLESGVIGDTGEDIDFNDMINVSDHTTFFNGQLRWKFGREKKWSLWGQYFSNNAKGSAVLTEDIVWDDLTFLAGTNAGAGVKLAVTRLFLGRSFFKNAQNDFGLGIGIHNLDISACIEGEVLTGNESTGFYDAKVSADQVLPNIGAWYDYSPSKNWLIHGRVDWISANIGDYDGTLWNASAGVGYQAWRHVGFDLSWQYFNLNLKVDSNNWKGKTDMTYSGPVISVNFSW